MKQPGIVKEMAENLDSYSHSDRAAYAYDMARTLYVDELFEAARYFMPTGRRVEVNSTRHLIKAAVIYAWALSEVSDHDECTAAVYRHLSRQGVG